MVVTVVMVVASLQVRMGEQDRSFAAGALRKYLTEVVT